MKIEYTHKIKSGLDFSPKESPILSKIKEEEEEKDKVQDFANLIQAKLKEGEAQQKIPQEKEDYQIASHQIEKLIALAKINNFKVESLSLLKKVSTLGNKNLLKFIDNIKINNSEEKVAFGEIFNAQKELKKLTILAEEMAKDEISYKKTHDAEASEEREYGEN